MFFPRLKSRGWPLALIGLLLTAVGQVVRIGALFTAGHNFTHQIADSKKDNHQLVTTGVYARCRHPGYAGWFWWSVGTQILLVNPVRAARQLLSPLSSHRQRSTWQICIVGFAAASFKFFSARIEYEEETLIEFFGDAYKQYRAKTPTLIPGIK